MTIEIPLTHGQVAIVDDADSSLLRWEWGASAAHAGKWYARRSINTHWITMHRMLLKAPRHLWVDHINRDTLDNRRQNLRLVEPWQNGMNKDVPIPRSGYHGVAWMPRQKKWRAKICFDGRAHYLGLFGSAIEAARAYDVESFRLKGGFARLNFPDACPGVEVIEVAR